MYLLNERRQIVDHQMTTTLRPARNEFLVYARRQKGASDCQAVGLLKFGGLA
jgi:hypothetical protein